MSTTALPPLSAITGTIERTVHGRCIFTAGPGYRRLKRIVPLGASSQCFLRHAKLTRYFAAFACRSAHSSWTRR